MLENRVMHNECLTYSTVYVSLKINGIMIFDAFSDEM